MNELEQKQEQLFWCIGALERLQSLGVIGNFRMHVLPDQIDSWHIADERRHEIVGDNGALSSAVTYICNRNGLTNETEINWIVKTVICFRDERERLTKWFLGKMI